MSAENHRYSRASLALLLSIWLSLMSMVAANAEVPGALEALAPLDTSDPRGTWTTFLQLIDETELAFAEFSENPSRDTQRLVVISTDKMIGLLDLSRIPPAEQRQIGVRALVDLVDVLRRLDLPDAESIPANDGDGPNLVPAAWAIPGTDIEIALVTEGPRAGEYLFSPDTVARIDDFDFATRDLPGAELVPSWRETVLHTHGWMIPSSMVSALPDWLDSEWLADPVWKLILAVLAALFLGLVTILIWRIARRLAGDGSLRRHLSGVIAPIALTGAVIALRDFILFQLVPLGQLADAAEIIRIVGLCAAGAWFIWHLAALVAEVAIASPRIPDQSLDAHLLRLVARVVGLGGAIAFAMIAGQNLGVPVLALAAGLSIGGLALGLAAQGSLENLIAAINIFLDRPVRVGDLCQFGGHLGFVERIGLRSTTIRQLDQTLVVIPNSVIAKGEITNYSRRDRFLFRHALKLDYGTSFEQLRTICTGIAAYLERDERTVSEPIAHRATVTSYDDWSINVEVFAYVSAYDYSSFLSIQHELLDGCISIVKEAGATVAFPSQNVYLRQAAETATTRGASELLPQSKRHEDSA